MQVVLVDLYGYVRCQLTYFMHFSLLNLVYSGVSYFRYFAILAEADVGDRQAGFVRVRTTKMRRTEAIHCLGQSCNTSVIPLHHAIQERVIDLHMFIICVELKIV